MLFRQLDCRKMREADWNGTPDGISNQSDCKGVVMAKSNANKLFSEFKSAKDFDAEVKRLQAAGVEPKRESQKRKSECTAMEWAQNLVYSSAIMRKPSNKAKRRETNEKNREARRTTARNWEQRNRKARNARNRKENLTKEQHAHQLMLRRRQYWKNPEKRREQARRRRQEKPELQKAATRRWLEKNPNYSAEYYQKNKKKTADRARRRRQNIPEVKIRQALADFARRLHNPNATSGRRHCGMSIADLRIRFESMWYGEMSWDNYGTYWEMDHWMPLVCKEVDLRNPVHCKALAHYSNLQPLTKKDNRKKGNDVYPEALENFLRLVKQNEHIATHEE